MIPASSSFTKRLPSGATATQTGRPYTVLSSSEAIKPVKKSCGFWGLPLLNGTYSTLYPENSALFQEPCWPTNAPFLYVFH